MLRFRLLKVTSNMHYIVPEAQAVQVELLGRTVYKGCQLVQDEIRQLTVNKTVVTLKKENWEGKMGNVFFFGNAELLHEQTASEINKKREEVSEEDVSDFLRTSAGAERTPEELAAFRAAYQAAMKAPSVDVPGNIGDRIMLGNEKRSRVGQYAAGVAVALAKYSPKGPTTAKRKKTSVVVDFGLGVKKVFMYLGGLYLISTVHLASHSIDKKVPDLPTALPNFDNVASGFKDILYNNQVAYAHDNWKMAKWYYAMSTEASVMDQLDVLLGRTRTPEDEEYYQMLDDMSLLDFQNHYDSLTIDEQISVVDGRLTPAKLVSLWEDSVYMADTDEMSDYEVSQYLAELSIGRKSGEIYDFSRDSGVFSNTHRYGPNKGMTSHFNHAKAVKRMRGFNGLTDLGLITKLVFHYRPAMVGGLFNDMKDRESREFRREMWLAVAVCVLYSVPMVGLVVKLFTNDIPRGFRGETSKNKRAIALNIGEAAIIATTLSSSVVHLALLTEKRSDPNFSIDRSFGESSMAWYYVACASQLGFVSLFRQQHLPETCSDTNYTAIVGKTFAIITALSMSSDNPDQWAVQFMTTAMIIPLMKVLQRSIFST